MALIFFWSAVVVLSYTYFVFPVLVMLRARLFCRPFHADRCLPDVSVIIAAHNEENCIAARISNVLAQDYPRDALEVVVASDGSEDATCHQVQQFDDPRITLLQLQRGGKGAALNAAAQAAQGEVLVFTDANSEFAPDALAKLTQPFADERVGGVVGNQVYAANSGAGLTGEGEMLYWSFDRVLKAAQSRAGNVTSATGAIYAIRRRLFEPVPQCAMDDFYISTGVVKQGFRLVFAPAAVAREPVATGHRMEFARKVRIINQGLTAVLHRRELLNPIRYGFYAWQLFSHKVLRRLACVAWLALVAVSPLLWSQGSIYLAAICLQVSVFLAAALSMAVKPRPRRNPRLLSIPYYFCMVNFAALVAVGQLLRGQRVAVWRSERHVGPAPAAPAVTQI